MCGQEVGGADFTLHRRLDPHTLLRLKENLLNVQSLQLASLQMQPMVMGTCPGMEARELVLTLVCLYCARKSQARISLSVSLFPCMNSEGVGL